ncbi:hypothetical protein ACN38_g10093 [Penicillium nordicum]|uniref:Uncharacterized protein n=1 Tax=Penicillium nordicum TaxID=229535 RepID=A0A0M8NUL0_9EURO|nr:hypothetical protein ACN38_g10093 [Penicillium nordicum]
MKTERKKKKKEKRKKNLSNSSPFTWLMPSLTSRFFFMSMFLYLPWLPTKGSLAVSVISFVSKFVIISILHGSG